MENGNTVPTQRLMGLMVMRLSWNWFSKIAENCRFFGKVFLKFGRQGRLESLFTPVDRKECTIRYASIRINVLLDAVTLQEYRLR